MDPITESIVGVVTTDLLAGTTDMEKQTVVDAYDNLKRIITRTFGNQNPLSIAIEAVEQTPDAAYRQQEVTQQVKQLGAANDPHIVAAANRVVALLHQYISSGGYHNDLSAIFRQYLPPEQHDRAPQLAKLIEEALASTQDSLEVQIDPEIKPLLEALQKRSFTTGSISVGNISGEGITIGHGSTTIHMTINYFKPEDSNKTITVTPDFDPTKFVDRKNEIKEFQQLLRFDSAVRILTIRDSRGSGKSHLMRYFRHLCTEQRIPVSLVDFRQLPNLSMPVFIEEMVRDFETSLTRVPPPIFARYQSIKQTKPNWGSDIASLPKELPPGWRNNDLTHKPRLNEMITEEFFEDLRTYCQYHQVVLLLDSFEQCSGDLQIWVRQSLIRDYFLSPDKEPGKLLLVVAGREVTIWKRNLQLHIIKSRSKLSNWGQGDFQQWLSKHGYPASRSNARFYHNRFADSELSLLDKLFAIQTIEQQLTQNRENNA